MNDRHPKIEQIFRKAKKFRDEMEELRTIVLECGLTEEVKWYQACYTFNSKNVVIISEFKEYCALNFFKGALLEDSHEILVKPGKNTQSGRQIRFTSLEQIKELKPILKTYLIEACKVEEAGKKVKFKKTSEYARPEELQKILDGDHAYREAFESLTPGRQRGYLLHFSAAKQSKTRTSRIEKCRERIFEGKGFNER
ncbi:YdeI/OmpD-associated family protein [bacterium]|nr:YdeI/OmpD-associated family protein [bacterium]